MIARPEPQQRRGALAQVGEDELAARTVVELERRAGRRIDQLGVDEAARSEVHPVLLLAFTPQRDADVTDPHRLGHLRSPPVLEPRPERRLAAARLTGDEHPLHAAGAQVDAALSRGHSTR